MLHFTKLTVRDWDKDQLPIRTSKLLDFVKFRSLSVCIGVTFQIECYKFNMYNFGSGSRWVLRLSTDLRTLFGFLHKL